MLSLGAFAFAAPGMLALLLALPVIYWLLRLIPPLPKLVRFPAIRLLIGLEPSEQTPMKMPWWLLLLRLLLATALILAVAKPLLNPQADLPGKGPLLLVIDDGWSSAPGWTTRIAHAERLIQRAERAGRLVALRVTASRRAADGPRKPASRAAADQGGVGARTDLAFAATATRGEGLLPAPPELRNRMARLDIEAQGGAGSTVLLDERNRRRPVAILGERASPTGQPLLQEVYFLVRALDPHATLTLGARAPPLKRSTAVL